MSEYYKNIQVKKSKIHGKGIFAINDIKKNNIIEICNILEVKRRKVKGIFNDYVFKKSKKKSFLALGYGSLYNHADDNNAIVQLQNDILYIIAVKDIKKGEEIFINYGDDYWRSRKFNKL